MDIDFPQAVRAGSSGFHVSNFKESIRFPVFKSEGTIQIDADVHLPDTVTATQPHVSNIIGRVVFQVFIIHVFVDDFRSIRNFPVGSGFDPLHFEGAVPVAEFVGVDQGSGQEDRDGQNQHSFHRGFSFRVGGGEIPAASYGFRFD